jgi:hypothetical protein
MKWFTSVGLGCALFLVPLAGRAQSPESILRMCLRDGKNTLRRMKRNIDDGARSFENFEKTCIKGPKGAKIKSLDGYSEVLKIYNEARAKLASAEKQERKAHTETRNKALAAPPGSGGTSSRQRWKARPARCQSPEAWDRAAGGGSARPSSKARISGMEALGGSTQKAHRRLFSGLDNSGRWPRDFTPDDHLARLVCGNSVEKIDPFFIARRQLYGPQILDGDSRVALAEAVTNKQGSKARLVLYRAALVHECFRATSWNLKTGYAPYVYCADAVGTPPGLAQVKRAMEQVFPGRRYEADNMTFELNEALQAMRDVDAAFAKMERRYPLMKQVYRDSATEARKRYANRRARYAKAYRVLDPMTARLFADPTSRPPADCVRKLLALRAELARELKPKDGDGVRELRVGHPLGYQITEALAWCYMGSRQMALAWLEADALRKSNRRISLAEEIAFSRLDALEAAKRRLKTPARILEAIPNYRQGSYGVPLPGSVRKSPRFFEMVDRRGRFEQLGKDARKPAVVAAVAREGAGARLTFKRYSHLRKYRDWKCKETNKIARYEVTYNPGGGTTIRPYYRQHCWEVGPVKTEPITYQEKPVVIPRALANWIKPGIQAVVLDNTRQRGDAAVIDLWWPKQGRKSAVVINGVKVR